MSTSPIRYDLTDEIEICYVLGKYGWSDLYFLHRSDTHYFRITHVFSDPLIDLIEMCCELLEGKDHVDIRLPDEPGGTILEVDRHDDQKHIVTVCFFDCREWDDPRSKCTLQLSFELKVRHFVDQLYHQFDKIQSLCREKSYRADRGDFPIELFLKLKALREK